MPPICIHLNIAREAAGRLHYPIIDQNPGSYLVGSTFPDVHIIAGDYWREQTHFFDLAQQESDSGVIDIFRKHPSLLRTRKFDPSTRSFMAGYLSHLVTDEGWILDVYRPCFGPSSPLGRNPLANFLDRLLQFDMDCRERRDRAKMGAIRTLVCEWEPKVKLALLDMEILKKWHEVVCTATTREPSLELFPQFARRFLFPRHKIDPEQLEQLLSALPEKVEWTIQYVTPRRLASFREKAISRSVEVAKEYLSEDN